MTKIDISKPVAYQYTVIDVQGNPSHMLVSADKKDGPIDIPGVTETALYSGDFVESLLKEILDLKTDNFKKLPTGKSWIARVEADPNDPEGQVLVFPDEMLLELDWKEGDTLKWDDSDGKITLMKIIVA